MIWRELYDKVWEKSKKVTWACYEKSKKPTGLTVAEIKAKLDELGIEYDKKANKAELLELLKSAETDQTEVE